MITFTILGESAGKNSREIVTLPRRRKSDGQVVKMPASIKSAKARDYERDALLQIPSHAKQMLTGPVFVTMRIFYADERSDLDESTILDILQAKLGPVVKGQPREIIRRGVYINDRQVRKKLVEHFIDRSNPRAEITVEPMQPQQTALIPPAPIAPRGTRPRGKPTPRLAEEFADIPFG